MIAKRTTRDTGALDPTFRPAIEELIRRSAHLRAFITDGTRTFAHQNRLYAQGRTTPGRIVTNARGGWSYHNYGLSVDIAFTDANGRLSYSLTKYRQLATFAKDIGLEWGGDWTRFPDRPHFQYPGLSIHDIYNHRGLPPPAKPILNPKLMTESQIYDLWRAVVHADPSDVEVQVWKGQDWHKCLKKLLTDKKWKEQNFLIKDLLRDKLGAEKL